MWNTNFNKKSRNSLRKHLQLELLETRTVMDASLMGPFANPQLLVDPSTFDTSRILVQFKPEVEISESVNLYGAKVLRSLELVEGLYEVQLPQNLSVSQALGVFQADTRVAVAEANYKVMMEQVPNDPKFTSLYGLNNTGQTGGLTDSDIDAPEAWNISTGTGQTIVAIIDTGVDYNHQDLASNMWRNPGEIAGDNLDNDSNGFIDDIFGADFVNNDGNPMDDEGHGTHVAGTIGAVGNNGIGVTGVNWNTRIMALKFLDSTGSGSLSSAISALNYAVTKGAKISNNSWGGGGYSSLLAQAINNAKNAGHIFVAAAGNESANNDSTPNYPSNYNFDNVVAVAATGSNDTLASFSNYGKTMVDLAAPGVAIYSTLPGNSYGSLSGTSMATPHVSGALSLLWDKYPNLSYQQVIQKLLSSVDTVSGLSEKVSTGGRLNLNKLLTSTSAPPSDAIGAKVLTTEGVGLTSGSLTGFKFIFNEAIQASSFTSSDVQVKGPTGQALAVSGVTAVSGTNNTTFLVTLSSPATIGGTYSLTAGPDILDLAGNKMNQDGDTINGESIADQFSATYTLNPVSNFTFSSLTPSTIQDLKTINSYITVGNNITISDINVVVDISHTWDSDLIISLTSPTGQTATLATRRGGSGDNFKYTQFDDEASKGIATGAAPFTGVFKPETLLSVFDGKNAKGIWRLTVADKAAGDKGTLNKWGFTIAGQAASTTNLTVGKKDLEKSEALIEKTGPVAANRGVSQIASIMGEVGQDLASVRYQTSTYQSEASAPVNEPAVATRQEIQIATETIPVADLAFSNNTGFDVNWNSDSWEETSEEESLSREEMADMAFSM